MTTSEALKRIKAMKRCTECQIRGKDRDCDDCITMYEIGTMGECVETFSAVIKMLGEENESNEI